MSFGGIGKALLDQAFAHGNHFSDMFGRTRFDIRFGRVQGPHVIKIGLMGAFGDVRNRLAAVFGARVDFIINVGDVSNVGHIWIDMAQNTHQRIKHNNRARITNMGVIIHRRPAHIEAHVIGVNRFKHLFFTGERIKDTKGLVHYNCPFGCGVGLNAGIYRRSKQNA